MRVKDLLSEQLVALRSTDTVSAARTIMAEQGVTELPVISKSGLYNYARTYMLTQFEGDKKLEEVLAYNPHAPRISEDSHIYEIVPVFAASDLQTMAVVNSAQEFIGIVDQKNIHKKIAESLTYKGVGAIVLLSVNPQDFAPSQIARLVEENGAKILGMMVENQEDRSLMVSIKLNTTMVKSIIATLRRFDIKVIDCFMAEDYNTDSQREYASVLRFFDI